MPLEYHQHKHWDMLSPVLEEHAAWMHRLMERVFYPEVFADSDKAINTGKPTSFAQWLVFVNSENALQPEIIEKVTALHSDLFQVADRIEHVGKGGVVKPPYKNCKDFITIYEEFMLYMRRLEKDVVAEQSGYDSSTGLRGKHLLKRDIARELDRVARQGKVFCVAMARIDNFSFYEEHASKDELDGYIKLVASLIKLSIRSYDDAYYMGQDEFALCMKQSEVSGGIAALERLRKELESQKVSFTAENGSTMPLKLSCCIAEPVDGDDIDELLANLKKDLESPEDDPVDSVLTYNELSPLQRFVKESETHQ